MFRRWRGARRFVLGSAIALGAGLASFPAAGLASADAHQKPVLLALGDSLAAGYQPFDGNNPPPVDRTTGFADLGYPGSYPADVASARGLSLVDLGCPGETSISMLRRPAEAACTSIYRREFGAATQLAAATAFLASHRGAVAAVTIDIGSNDADNCLSASGVSYRCLAGAEKTLPGNFQTIVSTLERALHTDDPRAPIVTMNYYDPFLGLAVNPGGSSGDLHASESLLAVNAFNVEMQAAAHVLGLKVANVAKAFKLDSALPLVTYGGSKLPLNVVTTCRLTWACPPSGPQAPNVHPNRTGYRTIAKAFLRALPSRIRA